MIGAALAVVGALLAEGIPVHPAPPAVRLAPIDCAELPDAAVRTPLRVELGPRLVEEPNDADDFLLLSISCDGSKVALLAVRQSGGAPARRLVPLASVAPEARAREVALAAVELVRVADLREEPPPPPPVVEVAPPPPPVSSGPTVTFGASGFLLFGGYLSGGNFWGTQGGAWRMGLEPGDQHPSAPAWQWGGIAWELLGAGTGNDFFVMNELLALFQRRGHHFLPEIGVGGRIGWISRDTLNATSTLALSGGPMVTAALGIRLLPGLTWDLATEAGYDLRGYGPWFVPRLGLTVHY